MGETPAPDQATPKSSRMGKTRAVSTASESAMSVISATQEGLGGAGSKQVLQASPSRVDVSQKRSRTARKDPSFLPKGKIDLGDCTFDEDSKIDASLVPRVAGKVRVR